MSVDHILEGMRRWWPQTVSPQSACVVTVQRFAALLQANARTALAPYELTFFEFEVLSALRASAPPHELLPSQLYDAILISSGGLTKVLKALEERGFVARGGPSGDRRRRPIALTKKGWRMAEKAMAAVQQADDRKLESASMTDADYERLAALTLRALRGFERLP